MPKALTYRNSGVDISKADLFIQQIKPLIRSTNIKGTVGTIGGFGGLFSLPGEMKNPLLVGATDGVGTKLLVANAQKRHDTIGIDLVAMCVNDIIACGARPLFFLDYFAAGKLENKKAVLVVKGIAAGCRQAGCAIIGGETAELPGLYAKGDYDLAGFSVGIIEKKKLLNVNKVRNGDVLIGLHSSGLHSNGFSLARKAFTPAEQKGTWGKKMLVPTRIYVKPILDLCAKDLIKSVSHITGGGFYENINRSIPKNKNAVVRKGAWKVPAIFKEIQKRGNVTEKEMYRTFNMGIGMVLMVKPENVKKAQAVLRKHRTPFSVIGEITKGDNQVIID